MSYGDTASVRIQPGVGADRLGGPQLVTRLSNQVHELVELRSALRNINKRLRGIQPSDGNKSAETPKPAELSLNELTNDITGLLEDCHREAAEASGLLS